MSKTPPKFSKCILSIIPTLFCSINSSLSHDQNLNIIGQVYLFKEFFVICLLPHLRSLDCNMGIILQPVDCVNTHYINL